MTDTWSRYGAGHPLGTIASLATPVTTGVDRLGHGEVGASGSNARPKRREAFACGSTSTTSTRCPASASAAARFTVAAVFPLPPLLFPIYRTSGVAPECEGSLLR